MTRWRPFGGVLASELGLLEIFQAAFLSLSMKKITFYQWKRSFVAFTEP